MNMKKIKILAALMIGLFTVTSCYDEPKTKMADPTEFVLNEPVYKNGVVDLENSSDLELTCSQPDYGFTAATTYTVQVSLSNDFTNEGSYSSLGTTYTTARMQVPADELAAALTERSGKSEEDFPYTATVYIRLKANLTNSGLGEIYSNVVEVPMRLYYALPPVSLPTTMYMIGGFCSWSWDTAKSMILTYDNNGTFWRLIYFDADDSFKFNWTKAWDGNEVGYAGVDGRITDNAGAGVSSTDDGNIQVSTAGWYLVVIRTTVVGQGYEFSLEINEPNVYLFGPAKGGDNAWGADEDGLFTVPTTSDGEFVSPAFAADVDSDSGVRACVIIDGEDWWHSEFMVFDGVIVYRATGGDQDRVTASAGQRLYLNFSDDTGYIE
jgi:hypothetical protein